VSLGVRTPKQTNSGCCSQRSLNPGVKNVIFADI
jgi:hypothetical protein